MTLYKIDRSRLETESTEDILRILAEDREDYTPDAIRIFEEILDARGVTQGGQISRDFSSLGKGGPNRFADNPEGLLVNNPRDAVRTLNNLLEGVLNRSLDPQVAQTASNIVMAVLRAMEQEFMTDSQEEP